MKVLIFGKLAASSPELYVRNEFLHMFFQKFYLELKNTFFKLAGWHWLIHNLDKVTEMMREKREKKLANNNFIKDNISILISKH